MTTLLSETVGRKKSGDAISSSHARGGGPKSC